MNARQELMNKIETNMDEDTTGIEEIVKSFIDDIEEKFQNIANLLSGFTIDKLDNVNDAMEIALDTAEALY
jgi:flagellar hook-basal body complex protein FliE